MKKRVIKRKVIKKNNFLKFIKDFFKTILIILFLLILTLFLIRFSSKKHLDDVSPEIPCDKELLVKSDVLFIIPKFKNISVSENIEWCDYILSLNKTLAMHGVYHSFKEFNTDKNQEYLDEGMILFNDCFKQYPRIFKPPQLEISKNNIYLIQTINRLKLYYKKNTFLHKVYHCSDTGLLPNKIIDIF